MSPFFVDTVFWVGLLRPHDPYYARAVAWQKYLVTGRIPLVTTTMVWWEFLNALSAPETRERAVATYKYALREPQLEIVAADPAAMERTVQFYASRRDKGWSLTDCLSFLVMEDRGLSAALTTDRHFDQAGFQPLLRVDPPASAR